MELDRTEIVIRQRGGLELLDLSLQLLKKHFLPLTLASSVLGAPLLVLDVWLIHWMVSEDALLAADSSLNPETAVGFQYLVNLIALFVMQFPLISLPATIVLGSLVFFEPMPLRQVLKSLGRVAFQALFIMGILRLGLVPIFLVSMIDPSESGVHAYELWFLFVLVPCGLILRAFWPFAPEIIGLERCPFRQTDKNRVNYRTRSRFLHGPIQGELLGRFFLAVTASGLLLLMLIGIALFLQGVITGSWKGSQMTYFVVFPICLGLVGLPMTVFRYLSYIDSRIQLEGWELDLRLRAEAARLELLEAPSLTSGSEVEEVVAS